MLRDLVDAQRTRVGPDHPRTALAHHNLGILLLEVDRIEDAVAAFRKARELKPFAITLDILMPTKDGTPAKDGWQVLRELKTDAATRDIPIIVLSSSSHSEDVCAAYDLGASL